MTKSNITKWNFSKYRVCIIIISSSINSISGSDSSNNIKQNIICIIQIRIYENASHLNILNIFRKLHKK